MQSLLNVLWVSVGELGGELQSISSAVDLLFDGGGNEDDCSSGIVTRAELVVVTCGKQKRLLL